MSGDICPHCDGTGERDPFSGARCYECNGTGWREDEEWTDEDSELWEGFHEDFYRQDDATP